MKTVILISGLLRVSAVAAFALPVNSQPLDSKLAILHYGLTYGMGSVLCDLAAKEMIEKDYAQGYMLGYIQTLVADQKQQVLKQVLSMPMNPWLRSMKTAKIFLSRWVSMELCRVLERCSVIDPQSPPSLLSLLKKREEIQGFLLFLSLHSSSNQALPCLRRMSAHCPAAEPWSC